MAARDDGGQAFPHGGNELDNSQAGMTLRDWFAGQALVGMLSTEVLDSAAGFYRPEDVARRAFSMADAMLEERLKPRV